MPADRHACAEAGLTLAWRPKILNRLTFLPTVSLAVLICLDAIFLNKTAAVSFSQYKVLDDAGFPNHRPVVVSLRLPALHLTHTQLKRPKQFPESEAALTSQSSDIDEKIFQECWHEHCPSWHDALDARDVEALFRCFNSIAESFLCRRGELSYCSRGQAPFCGRGAMPSFIKQPAVGISRPAQHGGAQTTVEERALRKLARQLEELLRSIPPGPAVWPTQVLRLWRKTVSRAAACGLRFTVASLQQCKDDAIKRADSLSKSQEYDALNRWRTKIKLDFQHHKRESFRWFNRQFKCSLF